MSDEQFETLIVLLRRHLLGAEVKEFAKGPEGGRDAKFVGTAELHPLATCIVASRVRWVYDQS